MNWHKDLAMASSPSVVIDLVNEYLALLPPSTPHVPDALRPDPAQSVQDIHDWHMKLSDALSSHAKPNLLLQDLCVVFVRASARLAELANERAANTADDAACG